MLIDAAARFIEEKRHHNITLEDVASFVGMSRGRCVTCRRQSSNAMRRKVTGWPRRVLNALTEGLLFERFQAPREITDEVIRAAFEALAPP